MSSKPPPNMADKRTIVESLLDLHNRMCHKEISGFRVDQARNAVQCCVRDNPYLDSPTKELSKAILEFLHSTPPTGGPEHE